MSSANGDRLPGPKFPFGRVVCTPGVLEKLDRPKMAELLRSDSSFSFMSSLLSEGFRIFIRLSDYPDGGAVHCSTTVLLPEEY